MKVATGWTTPLPGADPTAPTSRTIAGVPLYVSRFVAANTLWAVDGSRVWVVLREDATVESDRSVFSRPTGSRSAPSAASVSCSRTALPSSR